LEPDLYGASLWRIAHAENGGHQQRTGRTVGTGADRANRAGWEDRAGKAQPSASSAPHHDTSLPSRTCFLHRGKTDSPQSLQLLHACFSAAGCEIICFGSQGQLIIMDSVSGALLSTVPASMQRSTHALTASLRDRKLSESCIIVDAAGSVSCHLRLPSFVLFQIHSTPPSCTASNQTLQEGKVCAAHQACFGCFGRSCCPAC
jgi:hypothetical protein